MPAPGPDGVMDGLLATPEQQDDHITRIKRWCSSQKDRPIKVDVISSFGGREDSVTPAHGRLLAIEEHPTRKGIFRVGFDSHLHGQDHDAIMLGYEITGVEERGDQLTIHKGPEQRFELFAGVEPPKPPSPIKVEWPETPSYALRECGSCKGAGVTRDSGKEHTCSKCEGKGGHLVRQPEHRCPNCHGEGYVTRDEIYLAVCSACKGIGWQAALRYSEAAVMARRSSSTAP